MFQISDVSCRSGSHISHFTYTQPRGTTHVLLSQNADYLDGLQGILTGNEPYSGEIALNGRRYAVQRAAFMTRTFRMYREQTVIANVLTDLGFRQLGGKKGQRLFSALTEETGLSLDPSRTISQMTITEQKMVELLRIFDQKPELLIIRGLSNFVSVDMFQKMMQLVERLNEAGVTVLYLTNRLEEAISLSFGITVVDKRRIQGSYSPEEIMSDPRSIFFISMGAQKFDFGEEPQPAPKPDALGYGIQENLQMFTRYLVREMSASSAAAFVLDPVQKRVLTSVSCASDASETVLLRDEAVCTLLGADELVTLRPEQEAGWFERTPPYTTVLCYPVRISGELALVLQINYTGSYRCTPRDGMILKWIAQEMGISIENAQLMGNAVLLRESHHRIKNNLQVVVNLLELEKELLPANVGDPAARTGMEQPFDGTIQRIKCIAGVHDLLTMRKFGSTCEIGEIAGTVCGFYQNCAQTTLEAEPVRVPYAKAVSVALVINELVSNSIKHNQRLGRPLAVSIRVTQDDAAGQIVILYRDNGRGFPAQHPGAEAHSGAGSWILSSVVVYEFRGTMKQQNDGGAVVELRIPKKALLPLEKPRVASEELSTKAGGASG